MMEHDRTVDSPRRVHPAVKAFAWMGVVGGVLLALVAVPGLLVSSRASNDRNAWATMKTFAAAQKDFRANDRDSDKRADYWRSDVAGLFALVPPGSADPIRLIELSTAGADAAPVTALAPFTMRSPKAGYRALFFAGEDPAAPDPDRFAVCAFPGSTAAGRTAFIVDHRGVVHRRRWSGTSDTPGIFPADPVQEGWEPLP